MSLLRSLLLALVAANVPLLSGPPDRRRGYRTVRSECDGDRVCQRTMLYLSRHFDIKRRHWPHWPLLYQCANRC